MKGLILKDLYMIKKYLKFYLLMVVAFSIAYAAGSDSTFFLVYPTILSGALINTLLSYDESFRFLEYADCLPVSRKTFVLSKYALALIIIGSMLLINGISVFCNRMINGIFDITEVIMTLSLLVLTNVMGFAVMVPLTFRFGNEKGRLVFILTIGLLSAVFMGIYTAESFIPANNFAVCGILLTASAVIFIISMVLSVKFYEKRDL